MIVTDASWVIALRDDQDPHHAAATAILTEVGLEATLLHAVTLAGCLVAPARLGLLDAAATALRAAFEIVDADREAPLRWASIRADSGLRLPDAIVFDTARQHRARAIVTFDERLATVSRQYGIEVLGT